MLRTALGSAISAYLEDPSILEVMLNPDGRFWIDRLSGGLEDTGYRVTPADAERIARLVATGDYHLVAAVGELLRQMTPDPAGASHNHDALLAGHSFPSL